MCAKVVQEQGENNIKKILERGGFNAQSIMHNAQFMEVRFSHTVLRTTYAAHSIELKVGLRLIECNYWDFLGLAGKILALGIGYFAAKKANYPEELLTDVDNSPLWLLKCRQ